MTGCCPLCGGALPVSDEMIMVRPEGTVTHGGVSAHLSGREFDLVEKLALAIPRCVSRGGLYDWIYQLEQGDRDERNIDVHMTRIRRKLKPLGVSILTHWGKGFSLNFKGPVRFVNIEEAA